MNFRLKMLIYKFYILTLLSVVRPSQRMNMKKLTVSNEFSIENKRLDDDDDDDEKDQMSKKNIYI